MDRKIMVTQSSLPPFEEYMEEIRTVWNSHYMTNYGPLHNQFEDQLKAYLGVPNLNLFVNGHMGLELILNVLAERSRGREIITTAYSFCSTVHAIIRNGFTPVFCDIKESDFTIDPEKIEALITDETAAIVATHVYGYLCDDDAISRIAKKHGLDVIYDAAHAFGVFKNGMSAAQLGDAAMFSTHATKVFHTIEGGIVTYKDAEKYGKVKALANFGLMSEDDIDYIGTNGKMNEMCAAMGICNLRHLDEELNKRKHVAERYLERLKGISGIRLPQMCDEVVWNYAYFPIIFDGYKDTRDEIMKKLNDKHIFPRRYFYPALHKASCYQGQYENLSLPVTEQVASQVLTLPIYGDLELQDVDFICDVIISE